MVAYYQAGHHLVSGRTCCSISWDYLPKSLGTAGSQEGQNSRTYLLAPLLHWSSTSHTGINSPHSILPICGSSGSFKVSKATEKNSGQKERGGWYRQDKRHHQVALRWKSYFTSGWLEPQTWSFRGWNKDVARGSEDKWSQENTRGYTSTWCSQWQRVGVHIGACTKTSGYIQHQGGWENSYNSQFKLDILQ